MYSIALHRYNSISGDDDDDDGILLVVVLPPNSNMCLIKIPKAFHIYWNSNFAEVNT